MPWPVSSAKPGTASWRYDTPEATSTLEALRLPPPESSRMRPAPAAHLQERSRLRVALDIEPARRHAIAGQEVAQIVGGTGEPVADQPYPARVERRAGLPRGQQILDHREQLLLGRIPRLEQIVIER